MNAKDFIKVSNAIDIYAWWVCNFHPTLLSPPSSEEEKRLMVCELLSIDKGDFNPFMKSGKPKKFKAARVLIMNEIIRIAYGEKEYKKYTEAMGFDETA